MLALYRRHSQNCPKKALGRRWNRCKCPIWLDGTLAGAEVRESLKTRSWTNAEEKMAKRKAEPLLEEERPRTVKEAVEFYRTDAAARGLKADTLKKHRNLLEPLVDFAKGLGKEYLAQLTFEDMTHFRASWKDGALSSSKKLERLKGFFSFCVRAGWIKESPARGIKPPKVADCPTLPFTTGEMEAIVNAIQQYPIKYRQRLAAMTLTLRYTGLRISDAVELTEERVQPGRVFLYMQKTGEPVYVPIPDWVEKIIRATPGRTSSQHFFWSGEGDPQSAAGCWRRSFRKLFKLAKVKDGHPHRFRDTFAVELLLAGVPMEDVQILLGHKSIKTTEESYAPWVRARQSRLEAHVRGAWNLDPHDRTKKVQLLEKPKGRHKK